MEETLNEMDVKLDKVAKRKALIPVWIKVFGWLFIVMGAVAPLFYFGSLVFGFSVSYAVFGLEYEGSALAVMPSLIALLILVSGICAYGLLFGEGWGLNACIIFGYVGLALTIGSMVFGSAFTDDIIIRFEPLVQIPYLVKLHKIKPSW